MPRAGQFPAKNDEEVCSTGTTTTYLPESSIQFEMLTFSLMNDSYY